MTDFHAHEVELLDLARNVAAFDNRLLLSADLNVLRATLREFRDQARAAVGEPPIHTHNWCPTTHPLIDCCSVCGEERA